VLQYIAGCRAKDDMYDDDGEKEDEGVGGGRTSKVICVCVAVCYSVLQYVAGCRAKDDIYDNDGEEEEE